MSRQTDPSGQAKGAVGQSTGPAGPSGRSLSSADSTAIGTKVKVCCVCGESVSGKIRYKDTQGHYWCYECGNEDTARQKQPQPCADCRKEIPRGKLMSYEGVQICPDCAELRRLAAKRAAARIAAAEQDYREQRAYRKRLLVLVSILVVLALIYLAVQWLI